MQYTPGIDGWQAVDGFWRDTSFMHTSKGHNYMFYNSEKENSFRVVIHKVNTVKSRVVKSRAAGAKGAKEKSLFSRVE